MTEAQRAELIEAATRALCASLAVDPDQIVEADEEWPEGPLWLRWKSTAEDVLRATAVLAHLPAPVLPADVAAQVEALKAPYLRAMEMFRGECTSAEYPADELLEAIDRTAAIFRPLAQAERVKELEAALAPFAIDVDALDPSDSAFTCPLVDKKFYRAARDALAAPGDGE